MVYISIADTRRIQLFLHSPKPRQENKKYSNQYREKHIRNKIGIRTQNNARYQRHKSLLFDAINQITRTKSSSHNTYQHNIWIHNKLVSKNELYLCLLVWLYESFCMCNIFYDEVFLLCFNNLAHFICIFLWVSIITERLLEEYHISTYS